MAITATVRKRVEDRVTLSIPGYHYPYSIVDPKAKPSEAFRYEAEVTGVDEDTGRLKVHGEINITVGGGAVELVRRFRRAPGRAAQKATVNGGNRICLSSSISCFGCTSWLWLWELAAA
ncbi:hypothetical protein ACWGS9_20855 [Bradyrhizobium sp. Arg314]